VIGIARGRIGVEMRAHEFDRARLLSALMGAAV
jgi:hypothetical protein